MKGRPRRMAQASRLLVLGLVLLGLLPASAQIVQQPSPRGLLPWTCQVMAGAPGVTAPTGANTEWDTPHACGNDRGSVITITGIACVVDTTTGTPTIDVKFTDAAGASLLSAPPIACGTSWTTEALSGTPTLNPYTSVTTCSPPCEVYLDYNQSSAGATYVWVKITGTFP